MNGGSTWLCQMLYHEVIHWAIRGSTGTRGQRKQVPGLDMGGICIKKKVSISCSTNIDTFTGMSDADKDRIRKSWHKITEKETLVKMGMTFFLKLFAIYPYLQDYFPFLTERSVSITNSLRFRAQVLKFMYAMTAFVESMDDPDTLQALMIKIAETHKNLNITYDDMQRLNEVFMEFMQEMLGKEAKSSTIVAWKKLMTTFLSTYASVLKKDAALQQQLQQQQQPTPPPHRSERSF
ncbi:hypothetical protein BsWGS_11591 [Bradybaena similaris]